MVKRPPGNQEVGVQTPLQPCRWKNENWTLGLPPVQNVPQRSTVTLVKDQLIKTELGLEKRKKRKKGKKRKKVHHITLFVGLQNSTISLIAGYPICLYMRPTKKIINVSENPKIDKSAGPKGLH